MPGRALHALEGDLEDEPGLAAVGELGVMSLSSLVADVALDLDRSDDTRVLAIGTLGRLGCPEVGPVLRRVLDGGTTLLGRPRLAPKTPVVLAALRVLRALGAQDRESGALLALAADSPDPDVRRAAEGRES